MHQEIKRNQIPMLLVAIGWRFLHVFIAAIEIDPAKGVAIDYTAKRINPGFANRFADSTCGCSRQCLALEGNASMGRLA